MIEALLEKLKMDDICANDLCVAFRLGGCRENEGDLPNCFKCKFESGKGYCALIKELEALAPKEGAEGVNYDNETQN